jgi:predicted PurR-regulated permease PerM
MDKATTKQLYKVLAIAAGLFLLWQLQIVVLILLVSFLLTIILLPFVRFLHRYKLPSMLAVLIPLFIFVGILTGLGVYLGPTASEEFPKFIRDLPVILSELPLWQALGIDQVDFQELLKERFTDLGSFALLIGLSLLQGFAIFLAVIVLTMYWLHGYDSIKNTLVSYVPKKYQLRMQDIWHRAEVKLGRWFVGQMLISTAVGLTVWVAALALGLPFAGVLGIIAALLEIVPVMGPILASVPAILFGLADSLEKGLIVALVYIVIQQLESHVLSPLLMGRAVHLHPIVVLTAFLVGTILYGIVGGLLAVPMALLVSAAVDSFRGDKLRNDDFMLLPKTHNEAPQNQE